MISLKVSINRALLFLFDSLLICLCLLPFSLHMNRLLVRHLSFLPVAYWDFPPRGVLGLIVVMLAIFRALHAWLQRHNTKAARYFDGSFFIVFTLAGGASCYLTSRLFLIHASFPKGFALTVVLVGLALAWLLPRRLFWRKVPLFFAILISLNYVVAFVFRTSISVSDLFPVESPGVKVVTTVPNVLKSGPKARWFTSFTGIPMPVYHYRYITLDARQDFLFAIDHSPYRNRGRLCGVRLNDHKVVSCLVGSTAIGP